MRIFLLSVLFMLTPVGWSADTGEMLSTDFQVEVDDQRLTVYKALVSSALDVGDHYAFTSHVLSKPTTFRITPARAFSRVEIRPTSYGIIPKIEGGVVSVTIDRPCHISVECDGLRLPLFLFADAPEIDVPALDDPLVIRYGPGVHRPENGQIILTSGQTLYLERGAVVQAGVIIKKSDKVRIAGHGMLDGTPWAHNQGPTWVFMEINECTDVRIEGITMRGSYHWNIVPMASKNVRISGVKICAGRVQNDDGIDVCNASDVVIEDCFIRTDDDCLAIKGKHDVRKRPSERIAISNCVLWCDRARALLIGHESQAEIMRDITISNCHVLAYNDRAPIVIEPGENMTVENVTISDWTIDARMNSGDLLLAQPIVNEYMSDKVPGRIRNLTLQRVAMTAKPGIIPGIRLNGMDEEYHVQSVLLDHVSVNGEMISADSLVIGDHVSGVSVIPAGIPRPSLQAVPLISMSTLALGGSALQESTFKTSVTEAGQVAVLTIRDHDATAWGVEARFALEAPIRPNDRLRLSGFVRCVEPPQDGTAVLEFQVQRDTSPWVKSLVWRCAPTAVRTPFEQTWRSPIGISPGFGKVSLLFYQREQVLELSEIALVNLGPTPE